MNQLSFSPAQIALTANTDFDVDIVLNTGGVDIDGVDVLIPLNGVQWVSLTDHQLLPVTMVKEVRNNEIVFSQITSGGTHYNGTGTLFTVKLRANSPATLSFDWTAGSTNKTVVASAGQNIITSLGNLQITIIQINMNPEILAMLQAIVDQFGGELTGTYTPPIIPVPPPAPEPFDVKKS